MRLLLDTHILVWAAADPGRLTPAIAKAIAAPENELWFSPISAWELALLAERGRISLAPDAVRWTEAASASLGLREAPLNLSVAFESRRLAVPTADPADRFIAATARVYDCILVTGDAALQRVRGQPVLYNRMPRPRKRAAGA